MLHNIIVVAFDCDGVMFDTRNANMAYYNRILESFGLAPMTKEQFAYTHMHTVSASLDFLFQDKKIRKEAEEKRKEMNYFSLIKYMEIEPYLKPLLAKLRTSYKTAIATNRSDTMDRVLLEHGLEDLFDLVISALDVVNAKPDPEPLLKILKFFNIDSEQAIYIGDSQLDQIAAQAAGIPFVAYGDPSLPAQYHIESLKEIESIIPL